MCEILPSFVSSVTMSAFDLLITGAAWQAG